MERGAVAGPPAVVSNVGMSHPIRFPERVATEASHFVATLPYDPQSFLIDEVTEIDATTRRVDARVHTTKPIPLVDMQRGEAAHHPRHVNGGVLVHLTGMLGLVHAYFLNGLRFDDGWIGFGSRIHRADFKRLVKIGPSLELTSVQTKLRAGADRQVVRYEFRFSQEGALCYFGDQTAIWLRGRSFDGSED